MILTVEPFPGDYSEKQSLRETEERLRTCGSARHWDGLNPEKLNENIFETAYQLSTTTRENVVAVNMIALQLLVNILQPAAIVLSESLGTHSKLAIVIAGIPVLGIALLAFALLMLASIALIAVAAASTTFGIVASCLCVVICVILRLFLSVLPMIPLSCIFRAALEAIDSVLIGWKSETLAQDSTPSETSPVPTEEAPERHIDLSNSNIAQPASSLSFSSSGICRGSILQRIQPTLDCIKREVHYAAIPVISVFASMTSVVFGIIVVYFPKCRDVVYKEAVLSFVREGASPVAETMHSPGEVGSMRNQRSRTSGSRSTTGPDSPSQEMRREEQIRLRTRTAGNSVMGTADVQSYYLEQATTEK